MHVPNPDYASNVRRIFDTAPFIRLLGVELGAVAPGRCETTLVLRADHLQQDGFAHAGVLATVADHTAGGAGATLVAADQTVLSVTFTAQLLRPARGERLLCHAEVLRQGRRLVIVESSVWALPAGASGPPTTGALAAKLTVTLAVVEQSVGAR